MTPIRRKLNARSSRIDVTFRPTRNVTLEDAIKRDMPGASDAEVRFQSLWMFQEQEAENPQYWQLLRASVISALDEHVRGQSSLAPDIAECLRQALYEASQGEMSPLATPRRIKEGRGNRRTVARQRQVEAAVDYAVAVERGLIGDKTSRKSIADAYGVSREQVSRWMRASGSIAQRNSRFDERWSEYGRRGSWLQVANMVKKFMKLRSKEYRDSRRARHK